MDYIDDWDKQKLFEGQSGLRREYALWIQLLVCNKKEKPTHYYYYIKMIL